MEGTQTHVVCATFFQLNVLTHHVDNINAGKQILNKTLRYQCIQPEGPAFVFNYLDKAALTRPDTLPMSARPASFCFNTSMTLRIS